MSAASPKSRVPWRSIVLIGAVVAGVIVPFVIFGDTITRFTQTWVQAAAQRPFATSAVLFALLVSDIVVPVPSSLVSTACGMTLGFFAGTVVSFLGMTVTSIVGYLLGRYGSSWAKRFVGTAEFALMQRFYQRHGVWVLLALRPVPVMAEVSVVFSGLSRAPFSRVLAATSAGNLVVSAVYASIGVWGTLSDSFVSAFFASIAVAAIMLAVLRIKASRG